MKMMKMMMMMMMTTTTTLLMMMLVVVVVVVNFQTSLRVSSSARTRDTQICYNSKAEG
jgi:heme/copper-type cytochrome/quinol oxidase subunit 2